MARPRLALSRIFLANMKSRLVYLSIIILGSIISFGLARNLYGIYQNSQLQTQAVKKLEALRAENTRLQAEKDQATQPNFIEQEARNRLGLVRPGEVVVILPSQKAATPSAGSTSEAPANRPIWKQWLSLFFGG